MLHFGIDIKDKPSNHISKELYLSAITSKECRWSEESVLYQRRLASLNYDLNMSYFSSIEATVFCKYIDKQIKKYKFQECMDLNSLRNTGGIYMIVLDAYKQVYIGQTCNIRKRIMEHWNNKKYLDDLIFGNVCCSKLSIDSFGALDTTRIYYIKTDKYYLREKNITDSFDSRYLINRAKGGIGSPDTYTDTALAAKLAIAASTKGRDMTAFVDVDELRSTVTEDDFKRLLSEYPLLADTANK